jgi:hypothetical protein
MPIFNNHGEQFDAILPKQLVTILSPRSWEMVRVATLVNGAINLAAYLSLRSPVFEVDEAYFPLNRLESAIETTVLLGLGSIGLILLNALMAVQLTIAASYYKTQNR